MARDRAGSAREDVAAQGADGTVTGASQVVLIARCHEHGLHGERSECFICGGDVQQVPMVPCDNEAVERVARELHAHAGMAFAWEYTAGFYLDTFRRRARRLLRAAGNASDPSKCGPSRSAERETPEVSS